MLREGKVSRHLTELAEPAHPAFSCQHVRSAALSSFLREGGSEMWEERLGVSLNKKIIYYLNMKKWTMPFTLTVTKKKKKSD